MAAQVRAAEDAATEPGSDGSAAAVEVTRAETIEVRRSEDMVAARQAVRAAAVAVGLSLVDQTKIVTVASELARNCYIHGGGGHMTVERIKAGGRTGVRLVVSDDGPGIADVSTALTDGYTTGRGLGYGLGGTKRLVNEFHIESAPGRGTTVSATRWRSG